jgi:hypothetical protein
VIALVELSSVGVAFLSLRDNFDRATPNEYVQTGLKWIEWARVNQCNDDLLPIDRLAYNPFPTSSVGSGVINEDEKVCQL